MKIRAGFVSNSSSTSYVIALTRDFKTTQAKMQRFMDECDEYTDVEITNLKQADECIGRIVESLCSNSEIWIDDSPVENLYEFITVFDDDITITSLDGGPEESKVCNIFADSCKDKTILKLKKITESQNEN